jgi:septal ring-binding cell division protein DamX
MYRTVVLSFLLSLLWASQLAAQGVIPVTPVRVEPVFLRAEQMVTAGQDSAGRALVDSVLAGTPDGTPRYAEALFWRARLSKTAAAAERDYRRIGVEYPLSPRAQEALFRLAQLEMTRGDRASARMHLERIQREHPTGAATTRASVTLAQLAFDDGDLVAGCAAVAAARDGLTPADVELRNQVDYFGPRCANLAARAAVSDTTAAANAASGGAAPSASRKPADTTTSRADTRQEFTVQVAAYDTRAPAAALATRLSARGYAVRVVGDAKPYRVRVGRYPTRARAADAMRQMGRQNVRGVVVEAEPR